MDKFKDLDDTALAALLAEKQTAATALVESVGEAQPTNEQTEQALALTAEIEEIEAEQATRTEAAEKGTAAFAGLRGKVTAADESGTEGEDEGTEGDADEGDAEEDGDGEDAGAEDAGAGEVEASEKEGEVVTAQAKKKTVAALAGRTKRPAPPEAEAPKKGYHIKAGPETGFAAGAEMNGIEDIAKAAINRLSGFAPPNGDGSREDLQFFGIGSIKVDYEADNLVTRQTSDDATFEMLARAADEKRLEGESLVAAGGWCAPSETLYDLAADESLDGILSVPEVGVNRGGIRWTRGPQFADFYANAGFAQTEAQAIAGTTKPCYEVSCPSFEEMRLEAVGLCIKVPILTQSAYPELVNRFTSGTLIAHEHWLNARVIGKIVALAGAAKTVTGIGSTVADAMEALELKAEQRRQTYRLSFNRTMEVVVPHWVRGVMRNDLANRNGVGVEAVTDAQVDAHFSARNLSVSYVYDWQDLPLVDDAGTAGVDETMVYPATFDALIYPAGTFVKGVSDVINLSAVYDAASLAVNTYTGLFMERGLLVASMQYGADLLTIPVDSAGRTGRQDLAAANA